MSQTVCVSGRLKSDSSEPWGYCRRFQFEPQDWCAHGSEVDSDSGPVPIHIEACSWSGESYAVRAPIAHAWSAQRDTDAVVRCLAQIQRAGEEKLCTGLYASTHYRYLQQETISAMIEKTINSEPNPRTLPRTCTGRNTTSCRRRSGFTLRTGMY